MKRGKHICSKLKAIRRSIAEENNIRLEIPECTYEGDCRGTCPRCESEVKYLESELSRRARMGIAATVAGLAVTLSACDGEHRPFETTGVSQVEDTLLHVDTTNTDTAVIPRCLTSKANFGVPDSLPALTGTIASEVIPQSPTEEEYLGGIDEVLMGIDGIEEPEFPGGLEALAQFISDNLQYPEEARLAEIEGRVWATFVVEEDGHIGNIKILRDIGGGCGQEAVRIIKAMPKWKPGKRSGVAARTQYNIPVKFELTNNNE